MTVFKYAQIDNKFYKLMSHDELITWAEKLPEFEDKDFIGILTLMVNHNIFLDFIEDKLELQEEFDKFLTERYNEKGVKH